MAVVWRITLRRDPLFREARTGWQCALDGLSNDVGNAMPNRGSTTRVRKREPMLTNACTRTRYPGGAHPERRRPRSPEPSEGSVCRSPPTHFDEGQAVRDRLALCGLDTDLGDRTSLEAIRAGELAWACSDLLADSISRGRSRTVHFGLGLDLGFRLDFALGRTRSGSVAPPVSRFHSSKVWLEILPSTRSCANFLRWAWLLKGISSSVMRGCDRSLPERDHRIDPRGQRRRGVAATSAALSGAAVATVNVNGSRAVRPKSWDSTSRSDRSRPAILPRRRSR
jgi:hypothetical protein